MTWKQWVMSGIAVLVLVAIFGWIFESWYHRSMEVDVELADMQLQSMTIEMDEKFCRILISPWTLLKLNKLDETKFSLDLERDMPRSAFGMRKVLEMALEMSKEARDKHWGDKVVCVLPTKVTLTMRKLKIRFEGWPTHQHDKKLDYGSYYEGSEPVGSLHYLVHFTYGYQPAMEAAGYSSFLSFGYDLRSDEGGLFLLKPVEQETHKPSQRRIKVFGIVPSTFFIYNLAHDSR